jgi:hypothetical protein
MVLSVLEKVAVSAAVFSLKRGHPFENNNHHETIIWIWRF